MKGLDTPVLLGLLRGSRGARELVRRLGGEELATTEVNMFELEVLARADPSPGRDRRLAALEKLRRRLTVVPIDRAAASAGARSVSARAAAAATPGSLVLGALEAAGCSELFTVPGAIPKPTGGKVRIRPYRASPSKARE
jgi:predicted nucleic acid-binding protein